jgi:hypothetical protein
MKTRFSCIALAWLCSVLPVVAQTAASTAVKAAVQVPRLVRFTGTLSESAISATVGNAQSGASAVGGIGNSVNTGPSAGSAVGVTFALYSEETGGAPLWLETQNVQVDQTGHYTVLLGLTKADGLPIDLFMSGQAQWLGVQAAGEAEQPRIMLLSVPYALKAADAETFGGRPPSAYVAAPQSDGSANSSGGASVGQSSSVVAAHPLIITGSGTPSFLPLWTSASALGTSSLYQSSNGWLTWGDQTAIAPLAIVSSARGAFYAEGIVGNTFPIIEATALDTSSTSPVIQAISNSTTTGMAVYGNAQSSSGNTVAVEGTNASSTGAGVVGKSTATSGLAYGVQGSSTSSGGIAVAGINVATSGQNTGVLGQDASSGGTAVQGNNLATTGNAIGIAGVTSSAAGIGAYGVGVGESTEGGTVSLRPIGTWGDTNQSSGIGVLATADFGIAIAGYNNAENISTAKFQNDENTDEVGNVLATRGGHFGGICVMDVGGNLGCNGSKSAVVPVDGGSRQVALYAVEAPENWFEDIGSGQLSNGTAVVQVESVFAQTVNTGTEYHVFLTPKGDCKGLYVSNETADSFEVHELGGGKATIAFDYRIVARRKGYETIRLADKTRQFANVVNEPKPREGATQPKLSNSVGVASTGR